MFVLLAIVAYGGPWLVSVACGEDGAGDTSQAPLAVSVLNTTIEGAYIRIEIEILGMDEFGSLIQFVRPQLHGQSGEVILPYRGRGNDANGRHYSIVFPRPAAGAHELEILKVTFWSPTDRAEWLDMVAAKEVPTGGPPGHSAVGSWRAPVFVPAE